MTAEAPPPPPPRRRRHLPWTAIPLLLALGYAGVREFVGNRPSLEAMVPSDAILVRRWKDLDAYDRQRGVPAEAGATIAAPSAVLGAELNVPGLPGVDRSRPIVEALLPLGDVADPRLVVLPVSDGSALRARFRDPALVERHARHLELHGAWAASSSDRIIARDAGTFASPLPPSEGEDWCVTADWPAFVDFASRPDQAANESFAGPLAALGFDPTSAETTTGPDGRFIVTVKRTGRLPFVRDAWSRVTLRSFPGRIVVELDPAEDARELRGALASARPNPADDREVSMPPTLEASLHVRGAQGRRILLVALGYAGLSWPAASAEGEFAAMHLGAPGGITAWSELADSPVPTWNVYLAARKGAFPDLASLGRTEPTDAGPVAYAPGATAVTTLYGATADRSTFLPVPTAADPDLLVTAIGPKADTMRAKVQATLTAHARATPPDTADRIEVATFTVAKVPLQRLLGGAALGPNGLFAALAEHAVKGRLFVLGGARLRIEFEADDR